MDCSVLVWVHVCVWARGRARAGVRQVRATYICGSEMQCLFVRCCWFAQDKKLWDAEAAIQLVSFGDDADKTHSFLTALVDHGNTQICMARALHNFWEVESSLTAETAYPVGLCLCVLELQNKVTNFLGHSPASGWVGKAVEHKELLDFFPQAKNGLERNFNVVRVMHETFMNTVGNFGVGRFQRNIEVLREYVPEVFCCCFR